MLEVNVGAAAELDDALGDAVATVTEAATEHKTGILITRVSAGKYIVRAHLRAGAAAPRGMSGRSPRRTDSAVTLRWAVLGVCRTWTTGSTARA